MHAHPPATASLPAHKRRVVCYKWKPLLLLWTMLTLGGARGGTAWVLGGRLPHACIANPIDTGPACVSLRGIAWRGVSCRGVAGRGMARRWTEKNKNLARAFTHPIQSSNRPTMGGCTFGRLPAGACWCGCGCRPPMSRAVVRSVNQATGGGASSIIIIIPVCRLLPMC